MTKADFPSIPFHTLAYASEIEVVYTDGRVARYAVQNYWPMAMQDADVVECLDPQAPAGAESDVRLPVLFVPDPHIASIRPLATLPEPNRGSHPEVAISQTIDQLFHTEA